MVQTQGAIRLAATSSEEAEIRSWVFGAPFASLRLVANPVNRAGGGGPGGNRRGSGEGLKD
eukprot:4280833-Alexandrium_andersonii.AAC.1